MVSSNSDCTPDNSPRDQLVLPEIEETAKISTHTVETGVLRLTKHIHDVERTFNPTLHEQHFRVDRVPINRIVKTAPDVRTEGETTIVPVVEEVMVKLLILKEEVRITRQQVQKPGHPETVTLRREEVAIERLPAEATDTVPRSAPPTQSVGCNTPAPSSPQTRS